MYIYVYIRFWPTLHICRTCVPTCVCHAYMLGTRSAVHLIAIKLQLFAISGRHLNTWMYVCFPWGVESQARFGSLQTLSFFSDWLILLSLALQIATYLYKFVFIYTPYMFGVFPAKNTVYIHRISAAVSVRTPSCRRNFNIGYGRHAGYRAQCSLAKNKFGRLIMSIWRDLGPKYSAISVVLCHTHMWTQASL